MSRCALRAEEAGALAGDAGGLVLTAFGGDFGEIIGMAGHG